METKKQFRFFSIFSYEEEQEYLRNMSRNGWRFLSIGFLGLYTFEKCEPQDVIYQLDYNKEGLAHKEEYIRLFEDCGWEYLQDYVGYSYFRKPVSESGEAEEIFCDDDSKLDMLRRVINGRMMPLLAIFFAVIVPNIVSTASNGLYSECAVMSLLFVLYVGIFIKCLLKYRRLREGRGK